MSLLLSSLFIINFTICPFHPKNLSPSIRKTVSGQVNYKDNQKVVQKKSKSMKRGKGTVSVPWQEPPEQLVLLGLCSGYLHSLSS